MYRRNDPRLQRTLNQLSQNLESANESAQAGLFSFGQNYVNPCLESVTECWTSCTAPCFPSPEDRRRNRGRARGRAELSFDFYDDWEEDETDSLIGWSNDGLDRLLGAGGYGTTSQPGHERGMNYGNKKSAQPNNRRRKDSHAHDPNTDPTIIPSSSYFGILNKLPWNVNKGLKYKPSAADLTDHPGAHKVSREEAEPLIEESEEEIIEGTRKHRRNRSATQSSGHTTDSLSSRGDIFPSEDEIDDAVPLDDEFAMILERRTTGMSTDEASSGRTDGKRPSGSRVSTRTASSRSTRGSKRSSYANAGAGVEEVSNIPTLAELKQEEAQVQAEEEAEVEKRRLAAQKLAAERGLQQAPKTEISAMANDDGNAYNQASSVDKSHATYSLADAELAQPDTTDAIENVQSDEGPQEAAVKKAPAFVPARLPNFHDDAT